MVVRVSTGRFSPEMYESVLAKLEESRSWLEPALRGLSGLVNYYVTVEPSTCIMTNTSVWESYLDADQMSSLREMTHLREIFEYVGVVFEPLLNHPVLWKI